ncbi:MAG: Glu/Leu/Phe/Val dehydrogenase [Pyrinomonadaceae bacterium]
MQIVEKQIEGDHERVVSCLDEASGYHGLIAIHSTALGPAVGGTRFWNYASEEEAITDALRLARGMSYKNAFAGIPFGGGKSIIIGDGGSVNRELIFRAHGRFVETLGGRYVTAEDVGTSTSDMEYVRMETQHVAGLEGRSGDPSPVTAHGVFMAIRASAKFRWGADDLAGRTVAIQGCGNVGYYLAKELHDAGARLIATDANQERLRRVHEEFDAVAVPTDEIYSAGADIFAPCALGGIINDQTISQLKVEIVAGAANNQLLEARHGAALEDRAILYAPDYVANAGGIINGCRELLGWEQSYTLNRVREIYDKLLMIFEMAKTEKIPTSEAADRLAERRLQAARPAVR